MKSGKWKSKEQGSRRSKRHTGGSEHADRTERISPFAAREFMVDGAAAIGEYARFAPDRLKEILYLPRAKEQAEKLCRTHSLKTSIKERDADQASVPAPLSAVVSLRALELDELRRRIKGRSKDIILALDHITDPRNLGAIVRSAAFFGVKEILVPERRQVLLTQAAVNTAQGGFALTDIFVTVNLNRALEELKDSGYWVIGAAMGGEPLPDLAKTYDRVVIVLGSEDTGLSKQVLEKCDRIAAIAGRGAGLDSLNVSVAAGIFLCEFTKVEAATP